MWKTKHYFNMLRDSADVQSFSISAQKIEKLRKKYEEVIDNAEESHNFIHTMLHDTVQKNECTLVPGDIILSYQETPRKTSFVHNTICCTNDDITTIGRKGTILINNAFNNVSRLHAILSIVLKKNTRFIMIVDFWSKGGTRVGGKERHMSVPDNRRVIFVPFDKPVLLQLGETLGWTYDIYINGKMCIVCMDAPRSIIFKPCNHLVACESCSKELCSRYDSKCPLCRKNIRQSDTRLSRFDPGDCLTNMF